MRQAIRKMFSNKISSKQATPPALASVRSLVRDLSHVTDPNSFHRAIGPVLVVAQCFAFMPVDGILRDNATELRFRWRSVRVVYSVFLIMCSLVMTILHVVNLFTVASLNRTKVIVFSSIGTISLVYFLHLSTKWPTLMVTIHHLEVAMKLNYGYPRHLARNIRIVIAAILTISVVEYSLANKRTVTRALACADGGPDAVRIFYSFTYPLIFKWLGSFSYVMAALLQLINIVVTFAWNYLDIFIIMWSVMLTARFNQINHSLKQAVGKELPERFWRQIREDYNHLSDLVKLIDEHINKIVLLSFGNNLYFICLQLWSSITSERSLYFFVSFGHLLLRSTAMCLYASSIHEASKEPKATLFSVPSECYSVEVQRLIMQVTSDTIALTGLNFFSITKTLLLTVAGTIVTYEIVLVQISGANDEDDDAMSLSNLTHYVINPLCPNKTRHG